MAILSALFNRNAQHISQVYPGAKDSTSTMMQKAITDWFNLYYASEDEPEEDPCQRIPCTVVSKLQKACFSEYEAQVTREGSKGEFMSRCQGALDLQRKKAMQLAMIGGEAWIKPIPMKDRFSWAVVRRDAVSILGRDASGNVTDMVSVEDTVADGGVYHLLERRRVDVGGYLTIENRLYFSQANDSTLGVAVSLDRLPKYEKLVEEYTYTTPIGSIGMVPLKMPTENTVDGSMDGVSVYAPADRLIHNINHNEWLLNQEFDNGAIRVIASSDMLSKSREDRERSGRVLNVGVFAGLDEDPETLGITVFNPELRDQSFLARKREYLRNVESVIGIKRGLLSDVEAAERTAKEITSSEGEYNLTIQDLWQLWEHADREAMRLCNILGQLYRLCDSSVFDPEEDLSISWGNGVLYDKDKAWAETMQMVAAGLLKPELALAWKYDLPCDTPEDLAVIREKYMPQMEALLAESGE